MPENKPYCLMPWMHFHVGDRGVAKACCVANIPFGNVNNQSFKEIWEGEAILKLRDKFAKGEADPRCGACINREKGGAKSIRQETFERFPNWSLKQTETPIYFDIRFSNVCNFRCRTCWHGASSKWFQDAVTLKRNLGDKAIIKNVEDFDRFIHETGPALLNAEEIYLAGGEPLVTEEHYRLLDWLIENKVFPRLRYNSNFSVLKFKNWDVLKLWKHFPDVEVMASVDGAEKLGEYIRKEFNWKVFLENRKKLADHPNVKFKIAPTVSILNLIHLPDFYNKCVEHSIIQPADWYINILERPYYYNIKALPEVEKIKVGTTFNHFFSSGNLPINIKSSFQGCLDFMNSEDLSLHYKAYLKETERMDELRKEFNPSDSVA